MGDTTDTATAVSGDHTRTRPRGRVSVVLTDGHVLYGTSIREWDPVLTEENYAARARDELREAAARRRTTALPGAAASPDRDTGPPLAA
jgi:hypothetical protein